MSKSISTLLYVVSFIFFLTSNAHSQTIVYVDDDATANGDGTSWVTAYKYIQDALRVASADPTITAIRVAGGTYRPDDDETNPNGTGNRNATFQLISGVELIGGYRGCPAGDCAGGDPDERDITLYEAVLSGDLNNDDTPLACTQDSPDCDSFGRRCIDGYCIIKKNNNENSIHVVTGIKNNATAVLDGFTITAGNADGGGDDGSGAGLFIRYGIPTILNCTFISNSAAWHGAGISIDFGDRVFGNNVIDNCVFLKNFAGLGGGGIYSIYSYSVVTNCIFDGNSSSFSGAGMDIFAGNTTLSKCIFSNNSVMLGGAHTGGGGINGSGKNLITDCMFIGNSAVSAGGGMYNSISNPIVTGCTFIGNSAESGGGMYNTSGTNAWVYNCRFITNSATNGGGMHNRTSSNPMVTNCIFNRNLAFNGGGMYNRSQSRPKITNSTFIGNLASSVGGGISNIDSSFSTINNSIFWENVDSGTNLESAQIHSTNEYTVVNYSIVQGGWTGGGGWTGDGGIGNLATDPLFVDPDGADDVAGNQDDNFRLSIGSPAIDAADNDTLPIDLADLDDDGDTEEQTPLDMDWNLRFVDHPAVTDSGNGTPPIVDIGAYEVQCGNGVVDTGEDCDNAGESATCDNDCTVAECGDDTLNVTSGEVCDDGGESATCDADCTLVECGDATLNVTAGEVCDDGGESATCDADCTLVECGDGILNLTAGEECDDGNFDEGDLCSGQCIVQGACCDRFDGFCRSFLIKENCTGTQPVWTRGETCGTIICDPALGACCNTRFGTCDNNFIFNDCQGDHQSWTKGEDCSAQNCPDPFIPTLNEWGMVILTLLLLIAGKLYFGNRSTSDSLLKI